MTQVEEYIQKHHLKHKCLFCGAFISLSNRPSIEHYVHRKSHPSFCNRSCHGKHLAKKFFKSGEKHVAYKNGSNKGYNRRFTEMSIELLGRHCEECKSRNNVVTHYIDGNPRNNPLDGSNWQRLCKRCLRKKWWEDKKLTPEEKEKRIKWYRRKRVVQIPDGYTTTPKLRKVLNISRERMRQLRNDGRILYEIIGTRTYIYDVEKLIATKWIDKKDIVSLL